MTSSSLLSVVTISFNQLRYLRETVESVVSQRRPGIEYIVVDPGSTDGSREYLELQRGRIDHLILEPDAGPADGLNKGFARALGRIGYFLNSDDLLLPGAVDRLLAAWSGSSDFDALLGSAWLIDGSGKPRKELRPTSLSLAGLRDHTSLVVQQGVSFDMNLFRRVGGFNPKNRSCWDLELLCDFVKAGCRFRISNERFGAFRLHDESITGGAQGRAHQSRYASDRARILEQDPPDRDGQTHRPLRSLAALRRVARQPSHALEETLDRLFPARLLERWEFDHPMKASRN